MIEVEIRGRLTKEGYDQLKDFLSKNGELIESHEREMYMLRDYEGYTKDMAARTVDIRLRNTNGMCEIMLKRKVSENNTARREISLKLADTNLDAAKEIVKAFGCKGGLKMLRIKDVYRYKGIDWSLVKAPPKEFYYFEAEIETADEAGIDAIIDQLKQEAANLGLDVLSKEQMQAYIHELDREVNEEVMF